MSVAVRTFLAAQGRQLITRHLIGQHLLEGEQLLQVGLVLSRAQDVAGPGVLLESVPWQVDDQVGDAAADGRGQQLQAAWRARQDARWAPALERLVDAVAEDAVAGRSELLVLVPHLPAWLAAPGWGTRLEVALEEAPCGVSPDGGAALLRTGENTHRWLSTALCRPSPLPLPLPAQEGDDAAVLEVALALLTPGQGVTDTLENALVAARLVAH